MGGDSFAKALSSTASGDLRFQSAPLAGLQVEGVLLCVGDDSFAGDLPLEASDRALDAFVIMNLYLCHSLTSGNLTIEELTQRAMQVSIRLVL